ncbi:MAG: Ig-like domain-containing protein [Bacteroidales bacterium]
MTTIRKKSIIILFLNCYFAVSAQVTQTLYIDFGPNDLTNGNITINPDINNNYWNNITTVGSTTSLANNNNLSSNFQLVVSQQGFALNGIQSGGLLSPEIGKLGELAINTATQDFIFTQTSGTLKLRGLNIHNAYKFSFFGSRDNTSARYTSYSTVGLNSWQGTQQTSGLNLGGNGKNFNNNNILISTDIQPDATGQIEITVAAGSGGYAYLNMMKIEEVSLVDITSVSINGYDLNNTEEKEQLSINLNPQIASTRPVIWSVDNPSIATISATGELKAKQNGIVTITASIPQNGDTIKANKKINISNQLMSESVDQKFLFDFGPNDATNGNATLNPDLNGNYWNNISSTGIGSKYNLINTSNQLSNYSLTVLSNFFAVGILNGGLLNPEASKLDELAIPTATQDYFATNPNTIGKLKISGLNVLKGYRFSLFGSRENTDIKKTKFTLTGKTKTSGILQTSGVDLGGIGKNINNNSLFISEIISPNSNGEIQIEVTGLLGSYGFLNFMRMKEITIFNATAIKIEGENIQNSDGISKMNAIISPANATPQSIIWSVSDSTIASINNYGLLTAKSNGLITVLAKTITLAGDTLKNSKVISISNQFNDLYISGSAVTNADIQSKALKMNPTKNETGIIHGLFELSTTFNNSGTFKFYTSQTDQTSPVYGGSSTHGFLELNGSGISSPQPGEFLVRVNLQNFSYKTYGVDPSKITIMGSSVAFGYGATAYQGWCYKFGQLLKQRFNSNIGANWNTSNISIGGNNTLNILKRWDYDLLEDNSKYVIYSLSFVNEGLVGGGQPIFDQFKNNMVLLIDKARSVGKIPVVNNCYAANDYDSISYQYIKKMNLIIHQYDVPSINFLGALDNGYGKIAAGYNFDNAHPNDAGHAELFYTLVPSLFDALQGGKTKSPVKISGTYLTMSKAVNTERFAFIPDNTIHSFTTVFDIRTNLNGTISTFKQDNTIGSLLIENTGNIAYISPNGGTIKSQIAANDGNWHKITLTHYYAKGATMLYLDSILIGTVNEKLIAQTFFLNDKNAPDLIDYRDWMFYRSGMNNNEITALCRGLMLKSSLELYAPLDGLSVLSKDTLINLARSTNAIKRMDLETSVNKQFSDKTVKICPNLVTDKLHFINFAVQTEYLCSIFGTDGKLIFSNKPILNGELDVSHLAPNEYRIMIINKLTKTKTFTGFVKK